VTRSGVGAFWPGACLLEDLLLVRFPDLVAELLPLVDLPAEVLLLEGGEDSTAPELLETLRCFDDLATLGFALELLAEELFADPEVAPERVALVDLGFADGVSAPAEQGCTHKATATVKSRAIGNVRTLIVNRDQTYGRRELGMLHADDILTLNA
jgi:hypothetical protein